MQVTARGQRPRLLEMPQRLFGLLAMRQFPFAQPEMPPCRLDRGQARAMQLVAPLLHLRNGDGIDEVAGPIQEGRTYRRSFRLQARRGAYRLDSAQWAQI